MFPTDAYANISYFTSHVNKDVAFLHTESKSMINADLLFNLPATEQVIPSQNQALVASDTLSVLQGENLTMVPEIQPVWSMVHLSQTIFMVLDRCQPRVSRFGLRDRYFLDESM